MLYIICANSKNLIRNSVSFLPKFKKRDTLLGSTFFGTFFCDKYGKNISAVAKKIVFLKNRQKQVVQC